MYPDRIEIKSHITGEILFAHECVGNTLINTLHVARHNRISMQNAELGWACMSGAQFVGMDFRDARMSHAYLAGTSMDRANLSGCDLTNAVLRGVSFVDTELDGAIVHGSRLIGDRPILQLGPLGSRCAYLIAFLTDAGIRVTTGCFFGSLTEFVDAVKEHHGDNRYGREYMAAVSMIQTHAEVYG